MSQGNDREAMPSDDNFAETDIFTAGMLKSLLLELKHDVQLISPQSNERVNGSSTMLPAGGTMPVALYDRNRVKVTVIADGPIRIGDKANVNSGNGFMLPAGTSISIESVDEIWVGAVAQCNVSRLIERQGGDVQ